MPRLWQYRLRRLRFSCRLWVNPPLPDLPLTHWVIAEISSYHWSSPLLPRGVDNLYTDHLSRHGTLEHYFDKAHLLRQSQQQVLNGDDAYLSQVSNQWKLDACWTSVKGKADLIGSFRNLH